MADEEVKTADEMVSPEVLARVKSGDLRYRAARQFPPVLAVRCPRCDATGKVRGCANGYCAVDWTNSLGSWRDENVRLEELTDPDFGCGFDP